MMQESESIIIKMAMFLTKEKRIKEGNNMFLTYNGG